jgi:hypothetical protein
MSAGRSEARDTARVAVEMLLDALADRIAERLATRIAPDPSTRWATARDNPLGSARAFLDAGRRGDFPTSKRGREVVARWTDVDEYIAGRKCPRKARSRPAAPAEPIEADARRRAQLAAVGALPQQGHGAHLPANDGASVRRARGR